MRSSAEYEQLRRHHFEDVNICMLQANADPMFIARWCDVKDKPCVLNQLDMFLLVMR